MKQNKKKLIYQNILTILPILLIGCGSSNSLVQETKSEEPVSSFATKPLWTESP